MPGTEPVDVVCLGESMVTFLPSRPGPLADVPSFGRSIGGAESNVACALAGAGHRVRWVSRVGADGFGDHLLTTIAAHGVDTSRVARDPHRPTGVYFRTADERGTDTHEVVYYRAGSAASAMSPANTDPGPARVLHLTGITAALSPDCLALSRALLTGRGAVEPGYGAAEPGRGSAGPGATAAYGTPGTRRDRPALVSFDVNHRPGLWHGAPEGPAVLLELARGADVVFVGEDEAAEAWDVHGADAIRAALPEPETVIVKQGAAGATAYEKGADPVHVPGLAVDVVAPVGAGDAFAAGYLSGTLRGLPVPDRVRHGHLMAAAALTVPGDLAAPPAGDLADRLTALDADAWGRLRLGPGWTEAGDATEVLHP
ncbi:sugar kinase [Streptomyces sp. NPDC050504]|uniref:sugar kinase n=1 Tax=Streptomyces sp. NPDC050504 TaxID=3365618 RepID=UPI0037930FC0